MSLGVACLWTQTSVQRQVGLPLTPCFLPTYCIQISKFIMHTLASPSLFLPNQDPRTPTVCGPKWKSRLLYSVGVTPWLWEWGARAIEVNPGVLVTQLQDV